MSKNTDDAFSSSALIYIDLGHGTYRLGGFPEKNRVWDSGLVDFLFKKISLFLCLYVHMDIQRPKEGV